MISLRWTKTFRFMHMAASVRPVLYTNQITQQHKTFKTRIIPKFVTAIRYLKPQRYSYVAKRDIAVMVVITLETSFLPGEPIISATTKSGSL